METHYSTTQLHSHLFFIFVKRVGFAPISPNLINTHTFPPSTLLLVLLDFLHIVVVFLLNITFALTQRLTIAQSPAVHRTLFVLILYIKIPSNNSAMHSFTFSAVLLSASFASGVLASANIPRALLQVRQGGDAFIPGTRQGFGATCVDAFGPYSKLCANSGTCYDASIGDSCCSEGYPCGTGSYCLVKGYCCPDVCSISPPLLRYIPFSPRPN